MKTNEITLRLLVDDAGRLRFEIPPSKLAALAARLEPGVLQFPWQWKAAPPMREGLTPDATLFGLCVFVTGYWFSRR